VFRLPDKRSSTLYEVWLLNNETDAITYVHFNSIPLLCTPLLHPHTAAFLFSTGQSRAVAHHLSAVSTAPSFSSLPQ
jgi:hypothetical protein